MRTSEKMTLAILALAGFGMGAVLAGCAWEAHSADNGLTVSSSYRVVDRLACPEASGHLTRVAQASDGRTCAYRTGSGGALRLELLAVDDHDVSAALTPVSLEIGEKALDLPEGPVSMETLRGGRIDDAFAWKGYVARGPSHGPIVVAVVEGEGKSDGAANSLRDGRRLVAHNTGRGIFID